MRYKAQFCKGWIGTWVLDAPDDIRAWTTAWKYIHDHTQVVKVDIEAIFELNNKDEPFRKLPNKEDCEKIPANSERKKNEKQIEKAVYKVYFSDGECSGPFIADVSENDVIALDAAKNKLIQHAEYNEFDINKLTITKIVELNEDLNFTVNVERRQNNKRLKNPNPEKENRVL